MALANLHFFLVKLDFFMIFFAFSGIPFVKGMLFVFNWVNNISLLGLTFFFFLLLKNFSHICRIFHPIFYSHILHFCHLFYTLLMFHTYKLKVK